MGCRAPVPQEIKQKMMNTFKRRRQHHYRSVMLLKSDESACLPLEVVWQTIWCMTYAVYVYTRCQTIDADKVQ